MEHTSQDCQCEGKKCTKCKEVRCKGCYSKQKISKDGLRARCRTCDYEDCKERRERNKEKQRERRKYREEILELERSKKQSEYAELAEKRRTEDKERKDLEKKEKQERRLEKQSVPIDIVRKNASLETCVEREVVSNFFSKVDMPSLLDCWLWKGGLKPNGYGVFCVKRYPLYAHRWSYAYHNGSIPNGMVIDHICRNKQCVNPAHLRAVTQKDNLAHHFDKLTHCAKGHPYEEESKVCKECQRIRNRGSHNLVGKKPLKTSCPKGHLLTEDNVYIYGSSRRCKICQCKDGCINAKNRKHGKLSVKISKTHCIHGHSYTEENTIKLKRGGRVCRTCKNEIRRLRYITHQRTPKKRYSRQEWEALKEKYQNKCLRCGKQEPEIRLTADHVVSLKEGGAGTIDNIQPLCMQCNIWKRANVIDFRPQNP